MTHATVSQAADHRSRLALVFGLTASVFVVELAGSFLTNSLALLADAGHLLTDVAGVGLVLLAIQFAGRAADRERTFGYLRLEILAAVVNGVVLLGVAIYVLVEAWRRFQDPPAIASAAVVGIAGLGLLANAASVWLLRPAQTRNLTMRSAYLEVLNDLAGSVAVIVAALVVMLTGWRQADAVASALIAVLILPRTYRLLREAVDVLLEATPRGIDLDHVRQHIVDVDGVADVHDLHAWTITSGVNVLSAHVVLEPGADGPSVLDELCRCLSGDFDIEHSTFQLETADRRRFEELSHT
jgi:cobalt-zinc-cadmium efflux system protein